MLKYKNVVSTTFWFLRRLLKIEFVIWSRAKFRVSLQACQISRFAAQIVNERVKIVKSQVLVRGEKIRNFDFFMGTYRLYTRSCPWCPSTDQTPRKCEFQLRIRWCLNLSVLKIKKIRKCSNIFLIIVNLSRFALIFIY